MDLTRKEFIVSSVALVVAGCDSGIVESAKREGSGMLKGIDPIVSPDLLKALAEMGHGDEILFADAHFPGRTNAKELIRADGIPVDRLLKAIIPLIELDSYATPVIMTSAVPGDTLDPNVEARVRKALNYDKKIEFITRDELYERAKKCVAIGQTGEHAKYGNVFIKKGVTPVA